MLTLTLNFLSARSRISDPPSKSLTSIMRDPESRKWNLSVFLRKSSELVVVVVDTLCPRCGNGPRPTLYPDGVVLKVSWTGVRTLCEPIPIPVFEAYGWELAVPSLSGFDAGGAPPNELCF